MSVSLNYLIGLVLVTGGVTIALRAFPFAVFGAGGRPPAFIGYLGKVLAPGAIAMLVVFCFCSYFKDRPFAESWALPEAVAGITVVLLQLWRRNPLLSIMVGTVIYMLMIQH
ncbi:MAG: AzlD domain-containing protein [Victivallaceae bacterium]|nr:AzlD domain-containing protein [Victivallaceae bacterium]